ncbi:PPR18 protein, partial [Galbula dea]|nr:PPR18 protein [Galbula dea]
MRGAPRREPGPNHPALQRRSGNTITVRPARRGGAGTEGRSSTPPPPPLPTSNPPQGSPKKRYPTAEEIQVIGGYLALPRSCLAKNDPHRKKVRSYLALLHLQAT